MIRIVLRKFVSENNHFSLSAIFAINLIFLTTRHPVPKPTDDMFVGNINTVYENFP